MNKKYYLYFFLILFLPKILFAQAPSNDNCSGAIEVFPAANCNQVTGTLLNATPTNAISTTDKDVWYKFVAQSSTEFINVTGGGSYGIVPVFYVYSSCASTTAIFSTPSQTAVSKDLTLTGLTIGQTYYYRIVNRDYKYTGVTNFTFTTCITTPESNGDINDLCANAITLNVAEVCNYRTFSNILSTASSPAVSSTCASPVPQDVWFKAVVPTNGRLNVMIGEGTVNSNCGMAMYRGTCGSFTQVACEVPAVPALDPMLNIDKSGLIPGETIYIRFWCNSSNFGTYKICASSPPSCSANPPAADLCANATPICNLNGYCGNTGNYTADTPGNIKTALATYFSIENNSWISFNAKSTSAVFTVYVSNCIEVDYDGNQANGIQMVVFEKNCTNFIPHGYWSQPNVTNFVLTATNLTVGNDYLIMIDGCAGAKCDYLIATNYGVNTIDAGNDTTICPATALYLNAKGPVGSTYQWTKHDASGYSSAGTGNPLTINPGPSVQTTYTVQATGGALCSGIKDSMVVTINCPCMPPTITTNPSPQTICVGANTSFTMAANGTFNGNCQWQVNSGSSWTNISNGGVYSGATATTLNITGATIAMNGYQYKCIALENKGTCPSTTNTAILTVNAQPIITATTSKSSICIGETITLNTTSGASYSWSSLPTSLTSTVISPTHIPSVSTTYTVTVTDANGCTNTSTVDVTVNAIPNITINNPAAVCAPSTVDLTAAAITTGSTTGLIYSFWTDANATTAYNTPSAATANTYYIKGTTAAGCTDIKPVTVIVNPLPTLTISCGTTTISSVQFTWNSIAGATGYDYSYKIGNGSPITGSVAASPTNFNISALSQGQSVTITITPKGIPCPTPATWTCTASNCLTPIVNAVSNQTICSGAASTAINFTSPTAGVTFNWTNTNSSIGLASSGTGAINSFNASTVTSSQTGTISVVATDGICIGPPTTFTITVNPDASIVLSSTAGTDNQNPCINTAINPISYTIGGGGTGANVTGLPSGVNGSYSNGVFTITGTPTATGTFNYTVTTTGTCAQKSASGTITIKPDATIAISSALGTNIQSVCINTAITNITYNIAGGGTGATITGLPTGVFGNFNAGVFTISGTPTVTGTFNYTATTTGTCAQKNATGTITITPDASITLTSSSSSNNQNACINNAINIITYAIGGGGTGATITGLPNGISGTYANGVFIINGTPTVTGTFSYTINTTGTCIQKSATGTITVNPDATLSLTSANATTSQSVCINTPIVNIAYSIGGGGNNALASGLPNGVTGSYAAGVFTISGTPTVTGIFNFTVNTGGTCVQKSATGTITVNPDATISLTSAVSTTNQSICLKTPINNITYSIGGGGTGANATGLPAGVSSNYMNGTFTISGTPTSSGTFNFTVTTTGTCVQKSLTGTILINALPTAEAGIQKTISCTNTTAQLDANGTSTGTYIWTGGTLISGAGTLSPTVNQIGTYTLLVTDNNGCTATDNVIVSSSISTTPVDAGLNQSITCAANTTGVTIGADPLPATNYTYAWTSNPVGFTSTSSKATVIPSVTTIYSITTTNPTNGCSASKQVTITVDQTIPSVDAGSTQEINCFTASVSIGGNNSASGSNIAYIWKNSSSTTVGTTAKINVSQPDTYTLTITNTTNGCSSSANVIVTQNKPNPTTSVTANPSTICAGEQTVLTAGTGNNYKWSNSITSSTQTVSPTPTTTITTNTTYTVTVSNGTCSSTDQVVVTVNPIPTPDISATMPAVCVGKSTFLKATGGDSYSWNTTPAINTDTMTVTPLIPTTYTVTVSLNGCSAFKSIKIDTNSRVIITATPPAVCLGETAILKASGGSSYLWSGGLGNTQSISVTPLSTSSYDVTVTNTQGCSASTSVQVIVNSLPTVNITGTSPICSGSNTILYANCATANKYFWSNNTTNQQTQVSPMINTTYNVTITDNNGCTTSNFFDLTVNPTPVANAGSDQSICLGSSAQLNASGGTGNATYTWVNYTQGLSSTTINNPTATPNAVGNNNYTLNVTDKGCFSTDQVTITTNPIPVAYAGADNTICENATATLTASGGTSYHWSNGPFDATQYVKPISTTTYIVTVTKDGCSQTDDVAITVIPIPSVSFSSNLLSGCAPLTIQFTDNTSNSAAWNWSFGDVFSTSNFATIQNPTHTFNYAGGYNITLLITDNNNCHSSKVMNDMINVNDKPNADFTWTPNVASTDNPDIIFSASSSSSNVVSWNWLFVDSYSKDTTAFTAMTTHSYSVPGNYPVQLIVSTTLGCKDTIIKSVHMKEDYMFYIPNAFTPNGDSHNNTFGPIGTNIDPNHFQMFIYSRWGQLIYTTTDLNKPWDGRINGLNDAPVDVYTWLIKTRELIGLEHSYVGTVTLVR